MRSDRESALDAKREAVGIAPPLRVVRQVDADAAIAPSPEPQSGRESDRPARPRVEDAYETLLAPGEYHVALQSAERFHAFGREVWGCLFVVLPDSHSDPSSVGRPLLAFANALPKGKRPTRGWTLWSWYQIATGQRPPRNLAQLNPASFLRECLFRARVRTVKRDKHQVEVPPDARYSRLDALLERIDGGAARRRRSEKSER